MVDLSKLEDEFDIIAESYEVVAECRFFLEGNTAPRPLRIKIVRNRFGGLTPIQSHYIKASGNADAYYPHFDDRETIVEALRDAVRDIRIFYKPEDEGAVWENNPNF